MARVGFWLPEGLEEDSVKLWIENVSGTKLKDLDVDHEAGLQVAKWDLRGRSQNQEGQGRRRRFGGGGTSPAGTYTAVLQVGEDTFRESFELKGDPLLGGRVAQPEDEVDVHARGDG